MILADRKRRSQPQAITACVQAHKDTISSPAHHQGWTRRSPARTGRKRVLPQDFGRFRVLREVGRDGSGVWLRQSSLESGRWEIPSVRNAAATVSGSRGSFAARAACTSWIMSNLTGETPRYGTWPEPGGGGVSGRSGMSFRGPFPAFKPFEKEAAATLEACPKCPSAAPPDAAELRLGRIPKSDSLMARRQPDQDWP